MNILYIEDDLVDQMTFQRHLQRIDPSIQVRFVQNVQELEEVHAWDQYEMIFTDFFLGGIEACDFIERVNHPHIFLVSGFSLPQLMDKCSGQFTGILPKPIQLDDLIRSLDWPEWENRVANPSTLPKEQLDSFEQLFNSLKPEVLAEFEQLFEESAKRLIPKIQQAIQKYDFPQIGGWIHQLKSNLRILGKRELYATSEVLEYRCYNQIEIDSLALDLRKWVEELEEIIE